MKNPVTGFWRYCCVQLHKDFNRRAGIGPTMRLCTQVNGHLRRAALAQRQSLYREELAHLLRDHDGFSDLLPPTLLRDGFAVDRSHTLPHLQSLLRDSAELIQERGGQDRSQHLDAQQPWFYPLLRRGDLERFPSFLEFGLSSPLIATLAHALGSLPYLSTARPPGLRLMESNSTYDREAHLGPRESQLFHLDIHARPLLYAIVLLRDTNMDSGPWHFLAASTSDRIAAQLGYQRRGIDYRLSDEQVLPRLAEGELQVFTGKAGDVLFIDSSRCFHFGSRDATVPRYQMMYAYTGPVRADFHEFLTPPQERPLGPNPSRLRQLVLAYPC